MDILLDMKTISVTLVVGHLVTMILIGSYWGKSIDNSALAYFYYAKGLQIIAWVFILLRGEIPELYTILLANSLLFMGISLEVIALLKFRNLYNQITRLFYRGVTGISIVGFYLLFLFDNTENVRLAYASIAAALLISLPAYSFMRSNHSSRLVRIMGFFYFFVIVSLTARGLAALASKETLGLFVPDIYLSVSFVSVYLIMIVGNVGFILLLKEDSDKELFRLASYDDLTDTLNRRTFNLQGRKSLHQCAVEKSVVSFILMDVDFFKEINDRHGHHVGDQVLIDFSRKIHALLSEHALFGRYGGDEFGILLPHVDAGSATQLAEQIRSEIEHSTVNEWNVNYTVSLGIVTVQPDSQTKLEVLYIAADKALYEAKKKGRNCVSRADHATLEWGSMAISAMNRV